MQPIRTAAPPPFNLEQLRKFELVVQLGSFTAAAKQLDLTQPAISQQIRMLEKQLGLRLIERLGRSVLPTPAGIDLLKHLPAIDQALEAAFNAVMAHASGVVGRIRIGTGVTTCLYLLPNVLRSLRERYPQLELVVSTGNTDELVQWVEVNLIDMALVTLPIHSDAVTHIPILDDDIVAVRRRDAGQPWSDLANVGSFSGIPMVMFSPGTSTRRLIDEWFVRGGCKPLVTMELDSVEAIKAVVAAGLGCSLLPRMALEGLGHHPDLEVRSIYPPLRRTQAIVMRNDRTLTAPLRAVVEAVTRQGGHAFR
ncbi:LysR family transcriptional regulator [Acidovorax sp. NPDC077693]|uniref:LysR family transcriptional regulator n=1 Tax=unclassified Acidovorax TaxID=2684926 RepID=UPI0037CA2E0A